MATIYAEALGGAVLTVTAPEVGRVVFDPPTGTATLDFDGEANRRLVDALIATPDRFTLANGVLSHDGQPVPIATESSAHRDRRMLRQLWTVLNSSDPLTQNQIKTILRVLVRQVASEFQNQ
jgi:hypothetical protein